MYIKIGRFPGRIEELDMPEESTVKEAIDLAGLSMSSNSVVQVNGETATMSDILVDGDMVRITAQVKGN